MAELGEHGVSQREPQRDRDSETRREKEKKKLEHRGRRRGSKEERNEAANDSRKRQIWCALDIVAQSVLFSELMWICQQQGGVLYCMLSVH